MGHKKLILLCSHALSPPIALSKRQSLRNIFDFIIFFIIFMIHTYVMHLPHRTEYLYFRPSNEPNECEKNKIDRRIRWWRWVISSCLHCIYVLTFGILFDFFLSFSIFVVVGISIRRWLHTERVRERGRRWCECVCNLFQILCRICLSFWFVCMCHEFGLQHV